MAEHKRLRTFGKLLRNLVFAALLYGSLYTVLYVYQTGAVSSRIAGHKSDEPTSPGSGTTSGAISNKLDISKVNPHANWFNRPHSLVEPKDDYLGKRPDHDTLANLTMLVEQCRGSYEKIEKMRYVQDCLDYLANGEKEYYYLPERSDRESAKSPSKAEYLNADGAGNSLSAYPKFESASKTSLGKCDGPIVPYHVYWTGPATWRVEVFVKSYLYTQNLPCSRLFLWLDSDKNPNAVDDMLNRDPLFVKFLPFVERGDITVMAWKFPSRIPLPPGDNTDGVGYWSTPGRPNAAGERMVADGLVRDKDDQEWLVLTEKQKTFLPVAVSDAVRFVVLHIYGGAYFDMDVLMLRDMRPLLIGNEHAFAERWAAHESPGDYNTAVMSVSANSSLSSYLLRGGVRMGMNFHPRVVGRMAVKDGRNQEFLMLETATVDPIWTEFNWGRLGRCTIPCIKNYGQVFQGKPDAFSYEWESFSGEQKKHITLSESSKEQDTEPEVQLTTLDKELLAKTEYRIEEDHYPPNNRTLENFFRGAWTYHIHNQWLKNPEPSSWLNVIQVAQDGFFDGKRTNPYGEKWNGPELPHYEPSWEYA